MKLRRTHAIENKVVAKHMGRFFRWLSDEERNCPKKTAASYAKFIASGSFDVSSSQSLLKSSYHINFSTDIASYVDIAKRVTLVADTLLLSHDKVGSVHEFVPPSPGAMRSGRHFHAECEMGAFNSGVRIWCSDLEALGQWILDAEPLLRAGLAWYLPRYEEPKNNPTSVLAPMHFLAKDGKIVKTSGVEPIKSRLVRPILKIDLPFIDNAELREFSKITIDEFDSYRAFRGFLRQRFLDMDEALDSTQSATALAQIGEEIAGEVRAVEANMKTAKRKRLLDLSKACVGTATASLLAVYGPALQQALTVLGIGAGAAGIWKFIEATTDNAPHSVAGASEWYYVWALQKKAQRV